MINDEGYCLVTILNCFLALEEKSFPLDTSKHIGDQVHLSQMIFPLKCTLWAAAESNSNQNEVSNNKMKFGLLSL